MVSLFFQKLMVYYLTLVFIFKHMKPALRQITATPQSSFLVRKDVGASMLNNWHYHPEIELLFIKRSSGTWLIGDHIGHYQNGDMVLIGANLPHCFRHEYNHLTRNGKATGESICIICTRDFWQFFFKYAGSKSHQKSFNNLQLRTAINQQHQNKFTGNH